MRADLDSTLNALADPARRKVVHLLREGPRRSSELASALKTTRPSMSRHLRVLRGAGLIAQETPKSDARVRMVRLERAPLDQLRRWIDEVEAFWSDQLEGFRAHAESGKRGRKR